MKKLGQNSYPRMCGYAFCAAAGMSRPYIAYSCFYGSVRASSSSSFLAKLFLDMRRHNAAGMAPGCMQILPFEMRYRSMENVVEIEPVGTSPYRLSANIIEEHGRSIARVP